MRVRLVVGLWALAGLAGCSRPLATHDALRDVSPAPAADYLANAFDRYPLVAFSEPRHGTAGTTAFLTYLVRHPRFAGTVNDIVVEFGNARYQDIADRFVAGEQIPRDQLKQIWENTTVVTGVWTAPMYEAFLNEIRSLNKSLPLDRSQRRTESFSHGLHGPHGRNHRETRGRIIEAKTMNKRLPPGSLAVPRFAWREVAR